MVALRAFSLPARESPARQKRLRMLRFWPQIDPNSQLLRKLLGDFQILRTLSHLRACDHEPLRCTIALTVLTCKALGMRPFILWLQRTPPAPTRAGTTRVRPRRQVTFPGRATLVAPILHDFSMMCVLACSDRVEPSGRRSHHQSSQDALPSYRCAHTTLRCCWSTACGRSTGAPLALRHQQHH